MTFAQKWLRWGLWLATMIDYNGVGVRRGQRHIPSENWPKYPPRGLLVQSYEAPFSPHAISWKNFYEDCRSDNSCGCRYHNRELKQSRKTATRTSQICMKNSSFARFTCTCNFHFCTFHCRSHPFHGMKWPVLQLCGRREHLMSNFLVISKPLISV